MSDDIVENLKQPSQWFRVAFMVIFAVVLYVVGLVLTLLTVAQALFSLLTGSDNMNLRALGRDLTTYVQQILAFLTYNSDFKPFPFAPFPTVDDIVPPTSDPDPYDGLDVEVHVEEGADATATSVRAPRQSTRKSAPPAGNEGEGI